MKWNRNNYRNNNIDLLGKNPGPDDIERVMGRWADVENAGSNMKGGRWSGHRLECVREQFIGMVEDILAEKENDERRLRAYWEPNDEPWT